MGGKNSKPVNEITLYRGTNCVAEFNAIRQHKTAGGWEPGPQSGSLPTAEEVNKQKGTSGECAPIPKEKSATMDVSKFTPWVEYTTNINVANQFGSHRGGVVKIKVPNDNVFRVKNDSLENGVFLHRSTSVTIMK